METLIGSLHYDSHDSFVRCGGGSSGEPNVPPGSAKSYRSVYSCWFPAFLLFQIIFSSILKFGPKMMGALMGTEFESLSHISSFLGARDGTEAR